MKYFLKIDIAKSVALKDRITFKDILKSAFKKYPFSINITLSNENVEKVVSAPKKPVTTMTL